METKLRFETIIAPKISLKREKLTGEDLSQFQTNILLFSMVKIEEAPDSKKFASGSILHRK